MLKLSREHDFDVHTADFLLNKPSYSLIEQVIAGKSKIPVVKFLDSRDEKTNVVSRQLQKIARKDKFLFEESGAKDLYLGWPFVQGKFSDGTNVRCPLLFFPISLFLEDQTWYMVQREEESPSLNKTFLLAWQHYNQARLTEEFVDLSFEGFSKEIRVFKTELYELLKANQLEVDFNSSLFNDTLAYFREYKPAVFVEEHKEGRMKLFNEAVLGIFPQAGSYLVPDYDLLIEKSSESIEDFFVSTIQPLKASEFGAGLREADIHTPFQLDAPQEQALKKIKAGKSLVVQGPPGTGKSQLICNLIADFTSKGKKVLVVCQKRAALDVVYKRLETIHMHPFVALVHDFKADRTRIYNQIAHQIEHIETYKRVNSSLDTVLLERHYLGACKRIDQITSQLEEFKNALFDTAFCGISIKELYLTSNKNATYFQTDAFYKYFSYDVLNEFLSKLRYILPAGLLFDASEYPWKNRLNFRQYTFSDRSNIAAALAAIDNFIQLTKHDIHHFGGNIQALMALKQHLTLVEALVEKAKEPLFYQHFLKFYASKQKNKYIKAKQVVDKWKSEFIHHLSRRRAAGVSAENASFVLNKLKKSCQLLGTFPGRLKWRWWFKARIEVEQLLKANGLGEDLNGVEELVLRVENSVAFFDLQQALANEKLVNIGVEGTPDTYLESIVQIEEGIEEAEKWDASVLSEIIPLPSDCQNTTFISELLRLNQLVKRLNRVYLQHASYISEVHFYQLFSPEVLYQSLQELDSVFDALVEYDKEKYSLNFQELQALETILAHRHLFTDASSGIQSFSNSIRLAWMNEIEKMHPVLKIVSTSTLAVLEQDLSESLTEKEKLSKELLLLKLREQLYKNEEYNRLGNRTTFRDLLHQSTKKKKQWPLRKTIDSFSEELLDLLPCWLASPETVSAVMPLKELFDLVIFDEASQCFAEKGIPAIGRGKQIVIAGDSKQLPPSDLYRIRYQENDEALPEAEIDSLLDFGLRYFPQVMLTEHYRSRSLELIDFSNQYFYKQKLKMLPEFETFQSDSHGIDYVLVPGFFEQHTNVSEAEKVVELCFENFRKQPEKQIGVITFNIYQQQLIQDMMEIRAMREQMNLPETFVVKNIENIQGDEKDIILFSIGYAPDRSGRMQHHFGSLNAQGGENRLNVAITRAREKIMIVTSILPPQLQVESTLHEGPKLLKKYLEYALNVSEGRYRPYLPVKSGFRSQWYLKEKLKIRIAGASDELPFADLVMKSKNGKYEKLIFTDDELLFNSLSVKENFYYQPAILKSRNWVFERAFSRNE